MRTPDLHHASGSNQFVLNAKNPIDVTRMPETIAKIVITLRGATLDT